MGSNLSASQAIFVRCNVILPNGASVLVPIHENAKISELHRAAVLRASGVIRDFQHTVDATALKLGGRDAAYLWKDDSICEVVSDPENNTFILIPLEDSSCAPAGTQSPPQVSTSHMVTSNCTDTSRRILNVATCRALIKIAQPHPTIS